MPSIKGLRMRLDGGILNKMRDALEHIEGLEFASLFGSLAVKRETHHDIDIAVKASGEDKYEVFCRVVGELSEALNVGEERIDLVDLDRADIELKMEVAVNGIVLLDRVGYRRRLIDELNAKYPEYAELQRLNVHEWVNSEDPSTVNVNIVKRRLDFAKAETRFLRENVLNKGVDEVENSPILQRLMERSFHLTLETVLDVCRHIVSAMGWGPALSYSDYVEVCFKHEVIDKELKEKLIRGIRLRNLIIHRYLEVDYRKLYEEATKLEEITKEFTKQVLNFIKKIGYA